LQQPNLRQRKYIWYQSPVMKKILFLFLLVAGYSAIAQNVGIGGVPHTNAALEVRSANKGLLMPRLTAAARQGMIGVPAGMMVYDIDAAAFMYHDGNKWRPIADPNPDSTLVDYDSGTPEVTANMTIFTTTTAKSGILYDNGGPAGPYTNNLAQDYLVYLGAGPLATNDSTIMFKIVVEEMNLESPHDTLLIYTDTRYPVKFTGTTVRTFYLPAVGALRFNFQTNASVTQAGFKIRWSQVMARNTEISPRFGWYYDVMARAVRGGTRASEDQWDTEALGLYSFGWGHGAQGNGFNSFAAGWNVLANGDHSVAMGEGNKAIGGNSVALGLNSTAAGFYSFASGQNSRTEGEGAFATGLSSDAIGMQSFAAGSDARASGRNSVAMGTGVVSKGYATAFGRYNDTLTGASNIGWVDTDPLFMIGNGTGHNSRNNAMMITKEGNTSIGGRIPVTKLHIEGGTDASLSNNSGYMVIGDVNGSNVVFDNNEIIARNNGASSTLFLQNDGGGFEVGGTAAKPGGGSWAATSDARLKQDVRPYTEGLLQLMRINPVYYRYNKQSGYDTQKEYVGVLAQDLQKVAPYMVNTFKQNNQEYLSVDNTAMMYMLINAVKEQQAQIEALTKKLEAVLAR
jgi:hypothetical protein